MGDLEPNPQPKDIVLPAEDLLGNNKEMERLKDSVTRANGNVRILVHPFFGKNDVENVYYGKLLQRLLNSTSSGIPPIIVMEGREKVESTKKFLEEHSSEEIKQKLFYLPTVRVNDPKPYSSNPEENRGEFMWNQLILKLKKAGVTRVLAGGTNLEVSPYDADRLYECVGAVIGRLHDDFQVEISNIAAPKRRADIIKEKMKLGKYRHSKTDLY